MESWSIRSFAKGSDRLKGVVPKSFYARDTLAVARELLGKLIVVRSHPSFPLDHPKAGITVGRIVETEAYRGDDPASHSSRGETPRNSIMFGEAGFAYVYFIYGMYEMLNFVTERKGFPGAVLIRAVEPVHGEELMRKRRKSGAACELTSGPGKLCRAMGVTMDHYGESLQGPSLFVLDDGYSPARIGTSGRIGISAAQEVPWRFFEEGNPWVSKAPVAAGGVSRAKRRRW